MTATPRVAPVFDCSESLGPVNTNLPRGAVLTPPARSQEWAIVGATRFTERRARLNALSSLHLFEFLITQKSLDLLTKRPDSLGVRRRKKDLSLPGQCDIP